MVGCQRIDVELYENSYAKLGVQIRTTLVSNIYPRILEIRSLYSSCYNISEYLTIRWEIAHHTGNYIPYSFSNRVSVLLCPTELIIMKSCEIILIQED